MEAATVPPGDGEVRLTEFGVEDDRQMRSAIKLNANFLWGNIYLSWHVQQIAEDLAGLGVGVAAHPPGEQLVQSAGGDEQEPVGIARGFLRSGVRGGLGRMQVLVGGSVQHLARAVKARTMHRTVPRLLLMIPRHDAAEVRTNGGTFVERAVGVAIRGDLDEPMPHHASRARRNQAILLHFAARQPVEVLHRDVGG